MDSVIQIASMITVQGQAKPIVKNVMTLNSCAPIVGAEVMSFDTWVQWSAVSCAWRVVGAARWGRREEGTGDG